MAFTHSHTRNFSNGSGTVTSQISYSGGTEINVSETLAIGTNTAVTVVADVSALVSVYIKSDVAATIKVNSTGSPTKTITLVAEQAYVWPDGVNTNPLGASDTTLFYVTNTEECDLEIRLLQDPTP